MKNFFSSLVVLAILTNSIGGCNRDKSTSIDYSNQKISDAKHLSQGFIELSFEELPNYKPNVNSTELYVEPLDNDSIELFSYRGSEYYHPVNLSHRCFTFLSTYHSTNNQVHLDRAEKYASKLMEISTFADSAAYVPYLFKFALHGDSNLVFEVPWYSGMAQGEILEVMVRLYELTGKQEYLDNSHLLFQSFLNIRKNNEIWTTRLDGESYYWVEEYPHNEKPGLTLNGYIAAIFGLYDYYRVTQKEEAKLIYELSLTTIKKYMPDFRIKDNRSLYCLGHRLPASEFYHGFHISLFRLLYKISGDIEFDNFADSLVADEAARVLEMKNLQERGEQ